jgi:hypothetical protein
MDAAVMPFAANAVRFELHVVACWPAIWTTSCGRWQCPRWRSRGPRKKLIRIGAKVVSQGRYPNGRGRGGEAVVSLFREILMLIC